MTGGRLRVLAAEDVGVEVGEDLLALLRDLEPYGIKEMVQSGLVAIGRGSRSITAPVLRAAS